VYSFHGADVYAYLSAADSAVTKVMLATKWRRDQALIEPSTRSLLWVTSTPTLDGRKPANPQVLTLSTLPAGELTDGPHVLVQA
jgi:hypothetical protein